MDSIKINNAAEHNLKNISLSLPLYKITGFTGVSGSGKSTLLKSVIAAYGINNFIRFQSKTVKNALSIARYVNVDSIDNLPQTILINTKDTIPHSLSTVSTISGIHEILRNLFVAYGKCTCPRCNSSINFRTFEQNEKLSADVLYDNRYQDIINYINKHGILYKELFFDNKDKPVLKKSKNTSKAQLIFSLSKISYEQINEFNKLFSCRIVVDDEDSPFDPLLYVKCKKCGHLIPRMTRSRISFNTPYEEGGGACRQCHGSGYTLKIDSNKLIQDSQKNILNGGIRFVNDKGIQYTNINLSILKSFAKEHKIDLKQKICTLSSEDLHLIMEGSPEPFNINYQKGKKKSIIFKGIAGSLRESFISKKGIASLSSLCSKDVCNCCQGTRVDNELQSYSLFGKTLKEILELTIFELKEWCKSLSCNPNDNIANKYFTRLFNKANYMCRIACGHLSLSRNSNTLSGGELQRIRICTLFSSNINGICYLLDEPSSGLHSFDIESLGQLLKDFCSNGNTIVLVEHNKKLLSYCDWIVDLGPEGGLNGGNVLFSENIKNLKKHHTPTTDFLLKPAELSLNNSSIRSTKPEKFITFKDLNKNNLKGITVQFPREQFTVICGISGSGKTTFLRDIVFQQYSQCPEKLGFNEIQYLNQSFFSYPKFSTIGTLLNLSNYLAKIFSKQSGLPQNYFLPNSLSGKCSTCSGKGFFLSESNDIIGTCDDCNGTGFSQETLQVRVNQKSIFDILNSPINTVQDFDSEPKLNDILATFNLLGIGYLNANRPINTLSRGEFQRVKLVSILAKKTHGSLLLLDEPSKGLHAVDTHNLLHAIYQIVNKGNTVVAIEHNPIMISNADYLIEFGGTGNAGGYLLFNGKPSQLTSTPTAKMISETSKSIASLKTNNKDRSNPLNPIQYSFDKQDYSFNLNQMTAVQSSDHLEELASNTENDYLSVAIPGNIFYSKVKDSCVQTQNSIPFITIDFNYNPKFDISLYNALGIRECIIAEMLHQHPQEQSLLPYLFDDESLTGKCPVCRGKGAITIVPNSLFIEKGELSKACKKYLNKSEDFCSIVNYCKENGLANLTQSLKDMNEYEKDLLFYGTIDNSLSCDKTIHWPGLYSFFIQNHAYYPDEKLANQFYEKKYSIVCPKCQGNLLKDEYGSFKCWNMNYSDIFTKNFEDLKKTIIKSNPKRIYSNIITILDLLIEFDLQDLSCSHILSKLDTKTSALIRVISLYVNRIYGNGLLLLHTNILDSKQQRMLKKLVKNLSENNSIFWG